jgi:hypothetical protein
VESAAYARLARLIPEKSGDQLEIQYWEDPKLSEVIRWAGSFAPDTVIFDMAFLADDAGKPLGVLSSTRKLSEALNLPIYSCWETLLGNGIVGGVISGGFQQGEAAGLLALQILRGTEADSLPVVREGANRPMFDHVQLERFRIPERRLPPDSIGGPRLRRPCARCACSSSSSAPPPWTRAGWRAPCRNGWTPWRPAAA